MRLRHAIPIICIFSITVPLFAHPHVFIETSFEFVFDDAKLTGIAVIWSFDEIFSASVIIDHDHNKNHVFEEKESKSVERGAFSNLKNYDYFLHIDINGRQFKIKTVTDFKAVIVDRRIVYRFLIPLNIGAGMADAVVKIGCWDKDYFCDVKYTDGPVRLVENARVESSWEIFADKKSAYWGGFVIPKIVKLRFKEAG